MFSTLRDKHADTSVELIEYVDTRFAGTERFNAAQMLALRERLDTHMVTSSQAIDKAQHATELRLDSMNEFRAALNDANKTYVTRDMVEAKIGVVDAKVGATLAIAASNTLALATLKTTVFIYLGIIGAAIPLIIAVSLKVFVR